MVDVSIIVLCYKQKSTISRTLDYILSQKTTYTYEVIIGDDDSPDETREICEAYVLKFPNLLKINEHHVNYGVVKNYADCFFKAQGRYIMVCAGDDWWHNLNKIQLQIDYMEAHPNCSLCYSSYLEYYPSSDIRIINNGIKSDNPTKSLLCSNYLSAPSVCYRKKYISHELIASFVNRKYRVEDYPLWLNLSLKGDFYCIDEPLVSYTIQSGSIFHCKTFEERMSILNSTYKIRKDFVEDNNLDNQYGKLISDSYFVLATQAAIIYGERKKAIAFLNNVTNLNLKWRIKKCLICIPFTFNLLHKNYSQRIYE